MEKLSGPQREQHRILIPVLIVVLALMSVASVATGAVKIDVSSLPGILFGSEQASARASVESKRPHRATSGRIRIGTIAGVYPVSRGDGRTTPWQKTPMGERSLATDCAQALQSVDVATGGIVPPLHTSTTFARDTDYRVLGGRVYARDELPTVEPAERLVDDVGGSAVGEYHAAFGW